MHSSWLTNLRVIELGLSIGLWLWPEHPKLWLRYWDWACSLSLSDWMFLFKLWSAEAFCRITLHAKMPIYAFRIWLRLTRRVWSFAGISVIEYREPKWGMAERMLGNGPHDDLPLSKGQTIIGLTTFPGKAHSMCFVRIKLSGSFNLKLLTQWLNGDIIQALDDATILQISYCPLLAGAATMASTPPDASLGANKSGSPFAVGRSVSGFREFPTGPDGPTAP